MTRSALICEALESHVKSLEMREWELRDRRGYEAGARYSRDLSGWEAEAVWPEAYPSNVRRYRFAPCDKSQVGGVKGSCAVNLHDVVTVSQRRWGKRMAQLTPVRMREICGALRFTLGCDAE